MRGVPMKNAILCLILLLFATPGLGAGPGKAAPFEDGAGPRSKNSIDRTIAVPKLVEIL